MLHSLVDSAHLLFRSIADNHSSFLCRKVDKNRYLCSKMPNRMDD